MTVKVEVTAHVPNEHSPISLAVNAVGLSMSRPGRFMDSHIILSHDELRQIIDHYEDARRTLARCQEAAKA